MAYKLLWVDDEIDLLKAHILFLEKKGYDVDTASNGYDALDMCQKDNYDLILLDENMPGLSGLETLSRIKDLHPTLPVVMVTKSEEEDIMNQAIGNKMADYLIKPVNPNQIFLSIKKKENGQPIALDIKTATPEELRQYMGEVLLNFDRDRVHLSDIKKLIAWYNLLVANNLTDFEPAEEETAEEA